MNLDDLYKPPIFVNTLKMLEDIINIGATETFAMSVLLIEGSDIYLLYIVDITSSHAIIKE